MTVLGRAFRRSLPLQQNVEGATALEYSLIAGAIALVIVGGIALLGGQVVALFQAIVDAFGG